jgi:hypothetical protein
MGDWKYRGLGVDFRVWIWTGSFQPIEPAPSRPMKLVAICLVCPLAVDSLELNITVEYNQRPIPQYPGASIAESKQPRGHQRSAGPQSRRQSRPLRQRTGPAKASGGRRTRNGGEEKRRTFHLQNKGGVWWDVAREPAVNRQLWSWTSRWRASGTLQRGADGANPDVDVGESLLTANRSRSRCYTC